MFHVSIEGYRKTRPHRSFCFCQRSSFIVNGITEIKQHIAGLRHDVNTPRKRCRRDADMRSAAAAAARRTVTIGGGGVSKISAAAAHSSNIIQKLIEQVDSDS